MATATPMPAPVVPEPIPPLRPGDRLTRDEFERRYHAMPDSIKAELLEGVVYMSSPVSLDHGSPHFTLVSWMGLYWLATPGVEGADNTTLRLDMRNEPQPDGCLFVLPELGGTARISATQPRYIESAPELVAETAVSSAAYDLGVKLQVYLRHNVREYVVWRVQDGAIDWFIQRGGRFERLPLTPEGLYQSQIFPGLWLDPAALIRGDRVRISQVSQLGLASPEHAAYVARHQTARPV